MDIVQLVRDHEKQVLADPSALNRILSIRKLAKQHSEDATIQLASQHSLRRVFIHLLDSGAFARLYSQDDKSAHSWLMKQYALVKSYLLDWIRSNNEQLVASSMRTLLEVDHCFLSLSYLTNP